jgi:alpha-N-arabinofuranosidase
VLHAPVMTQGAAMWLTPTYYAFQLHRPHMGALALPVEVTHGVAQPGQSGVNQPISAVTACASSQKTTSAVTLINRHFAEPSSARLIVPGTSRVDWAAMLTATDPRAVNSSQQPDLVKPSALTVAADGAGCWRVDLPPHTLATIRLS